MRIEARLTRALREEAEARDVDVTRLWAETRGRLEQEPPRRSRRIPALAAAATAAVVVAGVAGLTQVDWSGETGPAGPVRSAVDNEFTCSEQLTYDWTDPGSIRDDYYIPTLQGGPLHQAQEYDAPRYEFEEDGDRAFLRFGNADGSLGLVTEFRRGGGHWQPVRTEACTGQDGNITVPVRHGWRLEPHGGEPYDASEMGAGPERMAYLVDDRSYYDGVGLVRHRSLYVHRCGKALCLTGGNPMSTIGTRLRPGAVPQDVTSVFLPPDELVGRTHPYGLWALYDTGAEVEAVTARLRNGREITAQGAYVDGWRGQLRVLLAPFDEVETITVRPRPHSKNPGARPETYTPQELPGYRDDLHP